MKIYLLKLINTIVVVTIITSCKPNQSFDLKLKNEIYERIEILEKSFKFSVLPINLEEDNFISLKQEIDNFIKTDSEQLRVNCYNTIGYLFEKYSITINQYSTNKNEDMLDIMVGLDNLIFKYIPSRLNFSDYKTVVVANKSELKSGDTLKVKIYLTVSDSLYEPEFKYIGNQNVYNLISKNGIGEFNMITRTAGTKKLYGKAIYSNEHGYNDTIDWNYEFKIK